MATTNTDTFSNIKSIKDQCEENGIDFNEYALFHIGIALGRLVEGISGLNDFLCDISGDAEKAADSLYNLDDIGIQIYKP